jgi:hypothetical protein
MQRLTRWRDQYKDSSSINRNRKQRQIGQEKKKKLENGTIPIKKNEQIKSAYVLVKQQKSNHKVLLGGAHPLM